MRHHSPLALALGLALLLLSLGGALSGHDVVGAVEPGIRGLGPSLAHPLGTDGLGRDVLARLALALAGIAAPVLVAAGTAVGLGLGLGTLQALSGAGGRAAAQAPTEILGAVPGIVLVLLLCVVGDGGAAPIGLGVGLALAPAAAGEVASALQGLLARGVFTAGRVHGLGWGRLLLRHAWWGACRHRLAARGLEAAAWVAALEATLSYLGGFGILEPTPSLGNMLAHGLGSPGASAGAWLAPGLTLAALAWSLDRIAAGLRRGAHVA